MRALDFGPLENLIKKYGKVRDIEDIPKSRITKPAAIFKQHENKSKIIPYDEKKALEILARGDAAYRMEELDKSKIDNKSSTFEVVGRNRLVMKHRSVTATKRATEHDE
jgi:anaerobic dimethyl sulfoxide reductase subunit B (iron-sulfur subunit)